MILVTGDKGYLGSVLTRKLDDYKGYDVVDGCDLNDITKLGESLNDVEAVVHLAAIVGEKACSKSPVKAYKVNSEGTWGTIASAFSKKVNRLIVASTCSVYGDCGEELVNEGKKPKPWGVYSMSKMMGERYAGYFGYTILRFGSLYGGKLPNESLPEVMRKQAQEGEVTVQDSMSWRPLTHVEDAAKAILFVLNQENPPKVLNVVGENIRKGYLAQLIAERYGAKVKLQKGKGRSYRVSSKRLLDLGFKFEWNVERWLTSLRP